MSKAQFLYPSHTGIVRLRTITVDSVEWIANPGCGYQPGWFISGICAEKNERRSFALSHIQPPEGAITARGHNSSFSIFSTRNK